MKGNVGGGWRGCLPLGVTLVLVLAMFAGIVWVYGH